MAKQEGGPAFPALIPSVYVEEQGKSYPNFQDSGMTLRDYFAAKAMQSLTPKILTIGGKGTYEDVAKHAYALADTMLVERGRR